MKPNPLKSPTFTLRTKTTGAHDPPIERHLVAPEVSFDVILIMGRTLLDKVVMKLALEEIRQLLNHFSVSEW
jgi:hypothetical protein